jgi:hypothetical protein
MPTATYVCPSCQQRAEARCSAAWCNSPAHSTRTVRMIPVEPQPPTQGALL